MSESSWATLVAAHERVQADCVGAARRTGRPPKHQPKAAILACSDARVPPSVLFDQPAGNLFVIRIAGNTAGPSVLASLDYAVAALDVDLIIVLGHTNCGAVTAAAGGTCQEYLEPVVAPICEIAQRHPGVEIDEIAALSVASTMATLSAHNGPLGQAAASGQLEVCGALHDLTTGRLVPVTTTNQNPTPLEAP